MPQNFDLQGGLRPTYDKRDYSFFPSFGAVIPPTIPDFYNVDVGLWNPSQNDMGLPFGCTSFTQTDLCIDQDGILYDVNLLEQVTQSNAKGGLDVRESLKAAKKVFKRTAFFQILPTGTLDYFDSIRIAMLFTREEKRAVSAATQWYGAFLSHVAQEPNGSYTQTQLIDGILFNVFGPKVKTNEQPYSWHNWSIKGWKLIDGQLYFICKPWMGEKWADKGFAYMSREVANKLFANRYAGAFTLTKRPANKNIPIGFDLIGFILHWWRTLISNA